MLYDFFFSFESTPEGVSILREGLAPVDIFIATFGLHYFR